MDRRAVVWAESGAMVLSGRAAGPPLGGPAALVDLMERASGILRERSDGQVCVDGLALLGERAALSGLSRQGVISCGGSARLVQARDGFVAVSLARPDDVCTLPAWLQAEVPTADPWPTVVRTVAQRSCFELDERAGMLGLPISALGSVNAPAHPAFDLPVTAQAFGERGRPSMRVQEATVVDLSALWAGPLCGQLLAEAGARVVKVESTSRPDGARNGPARFFDLLNGSKRSLLVDLGSEHGRRQLRRLIAGADVVIDGSRPRALKQLGVVAEDLLRAGGLRVWASVTSHGRTGDNSMRVGFGDTAAVAGGLVTRDDRGPCFLADAVADPMAGLVTAAAVAQALAAGGAWLIDAAMAPMAASVTGPPLHVAGLQPAPPRARVTACRRAKG